MTYLAKWLAIACACFAGAAAQAQTAEQTSQIEAVFDDAVSEQRVILNCSLTLADDTPDLLQAEWQRNASEALEILSDADFSTLYIFALRAKTNANVIIMSGDTTFSEVVEMCRAEPDWYRKVLMLRVIDLPSEIRKILEE